MALQTMTVETGAVAPVAANLVLCRLRGDEKCMSEMVSELFDEIAVATSHSVIR